MKGKSLLISCIIDNAKNAENLKRKRTPSTPESSLKISAFFWSILFKNEQKNR